MQEQPCQQSYTGFSGPTFCNGECKDTGDIAHGSVLKLEESEGFKMRNENGDWHSVCCLKNVAF